MSVEALKELPGCDTRVPRNKKTLGCHLCMYIVLSGKVLQESYQLPVSTR